MRSVRHKAIVTLSISVLIAVCLHRYLLDGLDGWLLGAIIGDDGNYASGYSEGAFRKVKQGMDPSAVRVLLGAPLKTAELSDHTTWIYSKASSDRSYRVRVVMFRDGRVDHVIHKYYLD